MAYNFDELIDRTNTDSLKHDFYAERGMPKDTLSMWVADMDFAVCPAITDALKKRCDHPVFGYSDTREDYFNVLKGWFARRFSWDIKREWLIKTPGVVFAINTAVRAFTNPGDAVIIQQPVYYPFASAVTRNGRTLVVNQLVYEDGRYHIDFADFEDKIIKNKARLFILCSPHNPVGRVWTKEELMRLGEICLKHDVLIVSDEIHADFVYEGHKHTVFSSIDPRFAQKTITCTSPSKTFNLAGLQISNIFIQNESLRRRFRHEMLCAGYDEPNIMGYIACKAAYEHGEEWLEGLLQYLAGNLALVREFVRDRLPGIRLVEPEGTYLVWLDCSGLGLDDKALDELIVHKAKLWLDAGTMFGECGSGFQRINIACPRSIVQEALLRIEKAVKGL